MPAVADQFHRVAVATVLLAGLFVHPPLYATGPPQSITEALRSATEQGNAETQHRDSLNVSLDRLARDPRDERTRFNFFNLDVLFENFALRNRPVRYGAPSHTEMMAVTTPLEFSTPPVISVPVFGWTRKGR